MRYNKAIVAAAGALLAIASRWVPVLEDADAELVAESVILALTALGVYAVPNREA